MLCGSDKAKAQPRTEAKPKVVIVGPIPPPTGGIATYCQDLLTSDLTAQFRLLHFDTSKRTPPGRPVIVGLAWQVFLLLKFLGVILWARPHIVHAHPSSHVSFFRHSINVIIAKLLGRKVVLQLHAPDFDEFIETAGRLKSGYIAFVLRLSDAIIVMGKYWKDVVEKTTQTRNLVIIPNGVNVARYKRARRVHAGQRNDPISVIFVGTVCHRKGVFDLLRATSRVLKGNAAVLDMVGPCDPELMRHELLPLCESLGLAPQAVRFHGELLAAAVHGLLASSDIYVLPSYAENCPIALLEAMACGLPLIATPVGAIPDIIEDGVNGFLVEVGDVDGLASKLACLVRDSALRAQMGERNARLAEDRFSSTCVYQQVADLYRRVLVGPTDSRSSCGN